MTTCPQCGQTNYVGAITCSRCAMPLARQANGPAPVEERAPEWLRQLQSTRDQGAPAPAPSPSPYYNQGAPGSWQQSPQPSQNRQPPQTFSAGNLVSDDALPDWLRAQSPGQQAPQPAPQNNGWQANMPPAAPMQPSRGATPNGGTLASALFDESALPDWLKQASRGLNVESSPAPHEAPFAGGRPPMPGVPSQDYGYPRQQSPEAAPNYAPYPANGAPAYPSGGIPQGYGAPAYPPQSASPVFPPSSAFPGIENVGVSRTPPSVPTGLTGPALIDPSALPPWLGGQQGGAPNTSAGGRPGNGAMNAQSLIDETALPQWLRAEPNTTTGNQPTTTNASPAPSQATRLDEPLPAWLNQVYAEANVPRIDPWSPPPHGALAAPMGNPVAPIAARGGNLEQNANGAGLFASDFVDESALPEWLRSQGAQPASNPAAFAPASASANLPPQLQSQQPTPFFSAPLERSQPQPQPSFPVFPSPNAPIPTYQPERQPTAQSRSNANAAEPEAPIGMFSASDLIDPAALPSWVQGEPAEPSFSSATGWTNRQPALNPMQSQSRNFDALEREQTARVEAPRQQMAPQRPRSPASSAQPGRPQPRAPYSNEPPMGRIPESAFDARQPDAPMGRRPAPPIPPQELPPWLQGTAPSNDAFFEPSRMQAGPAPQGHNPARAQQPSSQEWWQQEGTDQPSGWDEGGYDAPERYGDPAQGYPRQNDRRGIMQRFFGRK